MYKEEPHLSILIQNYVKKKECVICSYKRDCEKIQSECETYQKRMNKNKVCPFCKREFLKVNGIPLPMIDGEYYHRSCYKTLIEILFEKKKIIDYRKFMYIILDRNKNEGRKENEFFILDKKLILFLRKKFKKYNVSCEKKSILNYRTL